MSEIRRSSPLRVYLAGPGVFRPDCQAWGERLKAACRANGMEGLYPLDGEVPPRISSIPEKRHWVFTNNCTLIRQADVVFADLRAFRSESEPDSGTAFEVGFAHALGKPVWLWLPDCLPGTELRQRVPCQQTPSGWIDEYGMSVEDFSAPLNLMLWEAAAGVSHHADPEMALHELAQYLVSGMENRPAPTLVSRET